LFSRARRATAAVAAVVALGGLVGCTKLAASSSASTTHGTPTAAGGPPSTSQSLPPPSPAALAGGACLLMNFETVRQQLGVTFTVSAAADSSGTFTCVLQGSDPLPSLTLAITATELSTTDFQSQVVPSGATSVSELGKVAYQTVTPATKTAGPVIEVGWLSGNNRLIVFRYASPRGTTPATINTLTPKMIGLSKIVDQTTM
jgi:hypothetical protein